MTASTVKSSKVTAYDTIPVDLQPAGKAGNALRAYCGSMEIATTSIDEAADIIRFDRIPSNFRITRLMIYNDDLDAHATPTLTADAGFYYPNGGAVVDADGLASAITTLQAANTAGVNIAWEAHDIADLGKYAWQLAGLTSDPKVPLDVALTIANAAATAAAGTFSWCIEGILDS